jgi:hypothetical protein
LVVHPRVGIPAAAVELLEASALEGDLLGRLPAAATSPSMTACFMPSMTKTSPASPRRSMRGARSRQAAST